MKLVLLHGRDQQGKDLVKLKDEWIDSLKEGLNKSGLTLSSEVDICFPFYGNLLEGLVKQAKRPVDVVAKGGKVEDRETMFYYELLSELAQRSQISDQQMRDECEDRVTEKGPLNWKWIRAILKSLDKTPLATLSIEKFTHDVYLYLTVPGIRDTVNDFVRGKVGTDPCVFVSHSLGTILAYFIMSDALEPRINKFITLGSPLGLNAVRNRLPAPLKMPASVVLQRGWFNAFDPRDVVALFPLDKTRFNINPAIVNKGDVKNQTSNNHGIVGYLNDKEVARNIYEALQ